MMIELGGYLGSNLWHRATKGRSCGVAFWWFSHRRPFLRRTGKKNAAEMHKMEEEFVRAVKLELRTKAKEVFAVMEKFAGYGFNRSHAYSLLS